MDLQILFVLFYVFVALVWLLVWLKAFSLVLRGNWLKTEVRIVWFCALIFLPISCVLLLAMKSDFVE